MVVVDRIQVRARRRSPAQKWLDAVTFPVRAWVMYGRDRWGLSALSSERFDFVAEEVRGYCLDVGCGPHNRLITEYLCGNGRGIDVYPYPGLTAEQLVEDITHFPFDDNSFETVTFVANFNHIPRPLRDIELAEAYRCLQPGGTVIVTMGNPLAEILVHQVLHFYDHWLGTRFDLDAQRGMHPEETYYVADAEIVARLARQGFQAITKKHLWTQWWLNHLWQGWKNKTG